MTIIEELTRNTEKAEEFFANKLAFTLGPVELKKLHEVDADRIRIIDVRHADEYMKGHIPDAISIPADSLSTSMHHLSKDKLNIVYCYSEDCHLAARVARSLAELGYPVMELQGGFESWRGKDFDTVISDY